MDQFFIAIAIVHSTTHELQFAPFWEFRARRLLSKIMIAGRLHPSSCASPGTITF
jgi:hypothetical protein